MTAAGHREAHQDYGRRADVSMPRDLAKRRKAAGYVAIAAIGLDAEPGVYLLGAAEDIDVLLSRLQRGTWHELYFVRAVWTPGLAVARTIVAGAEGALTEAGYALAPHWYRVGLDVLDTAIEKERAKLRSPVWSNAELAAKLRRQSHAEVDRFAAGII